MVGGVRVKSHVSSDTQRTVYTVIRALGGPTTLELRRALPRISSTTIGKAVGKLHERGLVKKDGYPPRFYVTGEYHDRVHRRPLLELQRRAP